MAKGLSTQAASGFRDFTGAGAIQRLELMHRIAKVYTSFGFEALETPALENLKILQGSGGQENEKLIFKVLKRGEKLASSLSLGTPVENDLADLGLRFDLTVPLCRVVAEYQNEIKFPYKVFHIGPVWRAERPQRGRYREFVQCDVDIIGAEGWSAEVEVIQAVSEVFGQLGISDFGIKINHRKIIEALASRFGFADQIEEFAICLDKKDKLSKEKLLDEFLKIKSSIDHKNLEEFLDKGISLEEAVELDEDAAEILKKMSLSLTALNLKASEIKFDSSLVRGMGYYTGPVFELTHSTAGYALGGGGRYDKLIGRFLGKDLPAVGFSIGFERLLLLLEEMNLRVKESNKTLFIPVMSPELRLEVSKLAAQLREQGLSVDVYPDEAKLQKQLKFASAKDYRWVLFAGSEELSANQFQLKDFRDGKEEKLSVLEILNKLKI